MIRASLTTAVLLPLAALVLSGCHGATGEALGMLALGIVLGLANGGRS